MFIYIFISHVVEAAIVFPEYCKKATRRDESADTVAGQVFLCILLPKKMVQRKKG